MRLQKYKYIYNRPINEQTRGVLECVYKIECINKSIRYNNRVNFDYYFRFSCFLA